MKPGDYASEPSANCIDDKFKATLQGKIEHFNINPKKDAVDSLTERLIGFKNIVMEANENLYKRGDQIAEIDNKAAQLKDDTKHYQMSAKRVKKTESHKKGWMTVGIILVVLLLIYGGLVIGCGYDLSKCINYK